MVNTCPSDNSAEVDQTSFWSSGSLDSLEWDAHRIGWAIAGGCTAVTVLISFVSVLGHCRNYTNRMQQRQILRILYMPPVYAVISFLSYRFFRDYSALPP
ncbi:organic solute transporter Ostalpha-domain-containing protein [Mycena leptocephala]|nr:organic solute transporter Ostalpha-domain-containing protein [Mycena leptocephala]